MELDTNRPFRGSDAVRAGQLTWALLKGPGFRRADTDSYVAAEVPASTLLRVRAALVRAGPDAVATGWSACAVLGLDVASRPVPIELSTPGRRSWPGPGTVARRHRFAADEVTLIDETLVTTPLPPCSTRDRTHRRRPERG